ncbi:bacterial regulatory s, gntR family protein [Acinetobacter sp. 1294596]|uniref:aminotransferase-like domain-containing protein n=1 Tax=Acinetobacter sp. 1294596 TaxID=1310603 RepID=UPI00045016EF|nr:PLP-dependent aminotransferase family protein [Acinetobacter sp. 1294596]EXF57905.1 bacterial regulatory s, gntR family protein [Acinetobacter sp. 1294596]
MENNVKKTKIEIVMQSVREKVANRHLVSGARLPSVRAMAQKFNFSVSTVVEAYERLVTEELIEARAGAGYFVCSSVRAYPLNTVEPCLTREIDPLWISRQSLEAKPNSLKPGCGWMPANWMPEAALRKALRKTSRTEPDGLVSYSTPAGYAPLRHLIARRMEMTGVYSLPEQIILSDSGTQSIDLICRLFLNPGDVVLIDDPCYFNFHALLKVHKVETIAVPFTAQGPDIAAFQAALAKRPRLYITNAGIHNPTGASLSISTAYQILKLAEAAQLIIIEDDIFADLELIPAPRYTALNGFHQVIQIGSFSKTLSASIRCGYIAAKPEWVERLIDLKIATCFNSNHLNTEIIYHALTDSAYRKHLDWLRLHLAEAMSKTAGNLKKLDIHPWLLPKAGMFLWCQLPAGYQADKISKDSLKHGVILAPGGAFSSSPTANQFLRFNVAQSNHKKIYQILEKVLNKQSRAGSTDI